MTRYPDPCRCEEDPPKVVPWCPVHAGDDYDPSPYCSGCKAMEARDCDCGPRADND